MKFVQENLHEEIRPDETEYTELARRNLIMENKGQGPQGHGLSS